MRSVEREKRVSEMSAAFVGVARISKVIKVAKVASCVILNNIPTPNNTNPQNIISKRDVMAFIKNPA